MTCPYLKEVSMVFCRADPVKKPVPIDRVTLYNKMRKYGIRRDGEADEASREPAGSTTR